MLRDAESKIGLVLKAIPQQPEAWYIYGLCLSEFGRYFSADEYYFQAIDKFQRGLELKSSHPLLMHGMALAYYAIGELKGERQAIEASIRFFGQAAEQGGRLCSQFLSDWGVALMKLGEITSERSFIEEAAAKFEEAISSRLDALDGEEIELEWLYNYGCAMDFLGDFYDESIYYEKAVQVLTHVLKLDPDYIHARYNLALALSHIGELNADVDSFHCAIEQFEAVVLHDPEDEVAWNDYGISLLNLATLTADPVHSEKAQDFFDEAEVKLQHAAALGNLYAYYSLACLYALTNNAAAAIHYLEKAEQCDALPFFDDVIHDEWLDGLRDQPAYRRFISAFRTSRTKTIRLFVFALAFGFREVAFAHADCVRGHFNELVVLDVIDRLFQSEAARRGQNNVLIRAGSAHIGQLLPFGHVDNQVIFTAVLADDHPFIHFFTGGRK